METNQISLPHRRCGHQNGSTLLEVLVSIVILSVGLLGTAGLLINSMRAVSEQGNFVGASAYARELGELMMENGEIARQATNNPYLFDITPTAWPTTTIDCRSNFCTTADRASWDVAEWTKRVRLGGSTGTATIPGVKVKVCLDSLTANSGAASQWNCTPGARPIVVVKMAWASRDSTGAVENTGTGPPVPRAVFIITPNSKT